MVNLTDYTQVIWSGTPSKRRTRWFERRQPWEELCRKLTGKSSRKPLAKIVPGKKQRPLLWALDTASLSQSSRTLIEHLGTPARQRNTNGETSRHLAGSWLGQVASLNSPTLAVCLESLAWLYEMAECPEDIGETMWWQLLRRIEGVSSGARVIDGSPLAHTIANGEIPLTISYLLPVLENPKKVAKDAARSVSRGIDNLLDGEGMPKADYLHELRGLLASWTRSRYLIEAGNTSGLAVDAERQFEWILQQLVRMSRSDGSPVLAGEVTEKHTAWNEYSRQLVQAAIELSDDPTDEALTKVALPAPKNFSEDDLIWELPEPSYNSEWAELAVLRSGWSRRSNRATLLFSGQTSVMEVESNGRVLLSGDTSPVVHKLAPRDNRPVRLLPVGDWKQTCWYSDADADYVELELLLEKSVRVQRHLLLAKEDRFVLLADAVLAPESSARSGKSASLRHTLPLPLGPAFDYVPQKETFDGHLYHRGRPVATMLPLCLPEWRTGSAHGDLAAADSPDRLELTLNGRGERMFNAVFIDLDSRRSRKNATWRQLTIAQERTILPAKAAQGFRVQCYADQWVIYRSLAERGNRTVLGHNLVSEFLVARFKRTGEVETLVEIE